MLNFFVKTYGKLHNYESIPYWILTPFRRFVRFLANKILPIYLSKNHNIKHKKNVDVIVSFTSFPARINEVWQVIECIKRQSYKPKKIILWLSKEQFKDNQIPLSLLNRVDDIFDIKLVEGDIRSHKKYYYVSKEYSNSLVLLIDDDIYYPTDMIESLYNSHLENPSSLICQYGYFMKYDENDKLTSYKKWKHVDCESNNSSLFFGSGGGTLFQPSLLYDDLLDKNLFLSLTPQADDIWLNAMTKLANVSIYMIKPRLILPVKCKGDEMTLCSENVDLGGNDKQLDMVIKYYMNKIGINPFAKG